MAEWIGTLKESSMVCLVMWTDDRVGLFTESGIERKRREVMLPGAQPLRSRQVCLSHVKQNKVKIITHFFF